MAGDSVFNTGRRDGRQTSAADAEPQRAAESRPDLESQRPAEARPAPAARPFVGVRFDCCHAYTRVYENAAGTAYEGRCPRCGQPIRFPIGKGGSTCRFFRAS